ncbi:MAG: hypothetical protein JO025_27000 [Verrucomicrobia bacterium]|nr:hypothetical protein [Verrucomicrobiota bacterium]
MHRLHLCGTIHRMEKKEAPKRFLVKKPVKIEYASEEAVYEATEAFAKERAELIWRLSKT